MIDYTIEEEFLGLLLLKPDLCQNIVLSAECFLDIENQFIFKLFQQQYKDHKTISIVGIVENYKHLFNNKFQVNNIILKMTKFMNETSPTLNFDYYQTTLFSRLIKYKILDKIDEFKLEKISVEDLLNTIHKYESMTMDTKSNLLNGKEIFQMISSKNKNIHLRLKTLSSCTNIQEHDFVVIAARPGIGKSGFLLNLLEDLSNSYNCLFFNMEMSERQIYQRLVAINSSVPMSYQDAIATDYQEDIVKKSCEEISKKKIKIYSSGQTISTIRRAIINESKKEHTIVFIDYVGLIASTIRYSSLYEKITAIVKELRQITLDYNCTIFLAAQLNRNSEKSSDNKPKISDLKESGELEQSATTVLMLHDENVGKNISKSKIEMQCIIGKNRNGRVGIVKINYDKENQKFSEI